MNNQTADLLRRINNDFYRHNSASFSATRNAPWPGWARCLEVLMREMPNVAPNASPQKVSDNRRGVAVFDLACGNLRFEAFLREALPELTLAFYAVDACDSLVPPMPGVDYQSLDILGALQDGVCLNSHITAPLCDLSVSFGFMHHIPLQTHREEILASLIRQTHPGGDIMVSLWQFLNNEALAAKSHVSHKRALAELGLKELEELDENDCLLGWQNIAGAYRYCHSFSEAEIDRLVEITGETTSLIARFSSDGKTNNLNSYLILKVL
jgi:SAM-dependent methyltransferase